MTSISTTAAAATALPANPVAAARAQFLKTGIDKDAAAGDPDRDAGPKKLQPLGASGGKVPSTGRTAIASAVPTLNAAGLSGGASPRLATAAYNALR